MNTKKIKILAVVCMLVDHLLCTSYGPNYFTVEYEVVFFFLQKFEHSPKLFPIIEKVLDIFSISLGVIGRMAAVLFFFLLANGFAHTKNVKKYILRLLGFGVLAQIPYTLFDEGHLIPITEMRFNIMFTLAAALFTLWCCEKLKTRPKGKILAIFVVLIIAYVTKKIDLEYSYECIFYVLFFYYSKNLNRKKQAILGVFLVFLLQGWRFHSFLLEYGWKAMPTIRMYLIGHSIAVLLGLTYNGEKGKQSKGFQYFFYAFYPAHLLILGLIQMALYK